MQINGNVGNQAKLQGSCKCLLFATVSGYQQLPSALDS